MPPRSLKEILEQEAPRSAGERAVRRIHLFVPLVATAVVLAVLWVFSGAALVRDVAGYGVVSFFLLGKFVILKGITADPFTSFELACMVFWMDLVVSYLLTFNLDYFYRLPKVGIRLEMLEVHGRRLREEQPWVARLTFIGVMFFVMFPLTGTGAIGGSLFGRLLGMNRYRTFGAIALGSAIGCFGMAALADGIQRVLPESVRGSLWFEAIGIGLVLLVAVLLWLRARRIEHVHLDRAGASSIDAREEE